MRRVLPACLAAALALALAVGCSAEEAARDVQRQKEDAATDSRPTYSTYVALGDSFTAAPLVPTTDVADGCFRSDSNYPALVAERLEIEQLVDVSCSGAETADLVRSQPTVRGASVPPQLDALDPEADLVSIGLGGNDFGLFHTLVATCTRLGRTDPDGHPCTDALEAQDIDLVARTSAIGDRMVRAVQRIKRRAPDATVAVVGYLRLVPATGRCSELPFARGDYAHGRRVIGALNAALGRAARRTGALFVDMHAASAGHDVCAGEPWVNGHRTIEGEALAYHPLAEGMEAAAEELLAELPG